MFELWQRVHDTFAEVAAMEDSDTPKPFPCPTCAEEPTVEPTESCQLCRQEAEAELQAKLAAKFPVVSRSTDLGKGMP